MDGLLATLNFIEKGAFQQIPTSNENHVFLAILAKGARGVRRKNSGSAEDTFSLTVANGISLYQLSVWQARCCPTATSERRRIQLRAVNKQYCSARSEHQAFAVGQCLDCQTRLLKLTLLFEKTVRKNALH